MSYPTEKDKGRSFSVFWGLFQMGTLIGASITLGIQANSTLPSVSTAVYTVFLVIMLCAIGLSWLVLPPHLVVRGDRTLVEVEASLSPKEELRQFIELFKDWRMLALFPMFFSSNYFYAYQGAITAALFNGRTRALVALLTGVGSILGSILIGLLTDTLPMSRRNRAMVSSVVVTLLMCAVWGGGLGFQVQFNRDSTEVLGYPIPWDWTVGAAIGPIILMMSCEYSILYRPESGASQVGC
jgi:predicted MFS family arabinose efflux permease